MIKNIVFDLGGVLIDLDVNFAIGKLQKLFGISDSAKHLTFLRQDVFWQYETGQISSAQFLSQLQEQHQMAIPTNDIVEAWNSMLLGIPRERVGLIEQLQKKYRLFVLSNTNEIHVAHFEKIVPGYSSLSELFERVYYSHLIGHRKPTSEAYLAVLNGSGLIAEETLFIDDLNDNIQSAHQLGMKTLHVTNGLNIVDWFNSKLAKQHLLY